MPGYSVSVWFGLVGPAGMSAAITNKIQQDITAVLADPVYQQKYLGPLRLQGSGESPAQFKVIVASEFESWRRVIKDLGISVTE